MAEIDAPIDERLVPLVNQIFEGNNQNSTPKIQRVPAFLRQNPDFAKYCSPKIISFGPIHHQNENLRLGEQFKTQWTSLYFREYYGANTAARAHEAAQSLLTTVEGGIQELRQLFTEDLTAAYIDRDLSLMLLVDGCSLLYYLEHVDDHSPEELMLKLDQLVYTWRDITLLENQIPMRLLELLLKPEGPTVWYLLDNFNTIGETRRGQWEIRPPQGRHDPIHILDYFRSNFNGIGSGNNVGDQQDGVDIGNRNNVADQNDGHVDAEESLLLTYKNIQDLKKAGIRVKADKTGRRKCDSISFNPKWFSGEFFLPVYTFNDFAPYLFRNLVAYEMCPDFRNNFECCSFFSFMDSLIDDAEDVKDLRLAGVFQNLLGSDEELAKLFNEIGHDLPTKMFNNKRSNAVACSEKYIQVKIEIEKHYSNKWKTWLAEFRNTHFNSPWSVLAFLAALLALVLTFIQTWYAIHPKENNDQDKKIQELTTELDDARQRCESYQQNLFGLLKDMEEQKLKISVKAQTVRLNLGSELVADGSS